MCRSLAAHGLVLRRVRLDLRRLTYSRAVYKVRPVCKFLLELTSHVNTHHRDLAACIHGQINSALGINRDSRQRQRTILSSSCRRGTCRGNSCAAHPENRVRRCIAAVLTAMRDVPRQQHEQPAWISIPHVLTWRHQVLGLCIHHVRHASRKSIDALHIGMPAGILPGLK